MNRKRERKRERERSLKHLFLEILIIILLVADIVLFYNSQIVSSVIMIALVIFTFIFFHTKKDIAFYVVGLILATAGELVCVKFGVWVNVNPLFWGIPLWSPVVWGLAFLIINRLRNTIFKLESIRTERYPPPIKSKGWAIAYLMFMYILLILFLSFLWRDNVAVFIIISVLLFINILIFHSKEDIYYILILSVVASISEMVITASGAWYFNNPTFLNIPFWLAIGYGYLGLIVRRTAVTVNNYFRKTA